MSEKLTDIRNDQLYNKGRSVAATAYDAVINSIPDSEPNSTESIDEETFEEEYETAKSKAEFWPFKNKDDLVDAIDQSSDLDNRKEDMKEFSSVVYEKLKDKKQRLEQTEVEEEGDEVTDENKQQESANEPTKKDTSSKDNQLEEKTTTEEDTISSDPSTPTASEDQPSNESPFNSAEEADPEDKTTTATSDSTDTREDQDNQQTSEDTLTSEQTSHSKDSNNRPKVPMINNDKTEFQIASDMFYGFIGEEKVKYRDIKQKYDTDFPPRSVSLTEVINTSGTREERIRALTEWVQHWYQNEDELSRLQDYSRSPMGKPTP